MTPEEFAASTGIGIHPELDALLTAQMLQDIGLQLYKEWRSKPWYKRAILRVVWWAYCLIEKFREGGQ